MAAPMVEYALDYALTFGLAVVPAGVKVPLRLEGLNENGLDGATKDPDLIRRYWAAAPMANVSARTGAASGVILLDIDAKGEIDGYASLARLQADYGPLPQGWVSRTPSGGEHRYFAQPPGRELRNRTHLTVWRDRKPVTKYWGLDVKAHRGLAALPPSRRGAGVYRWVVPPDACDLPQPPAWLLDIIDPPEPPREEAPPLALGSAERAARYVEAAINGECGELARMKPNTGRNDKLFRAAAALGGLVGANLVREDVVARALEDAARDCGLPQEDGWHGVRATIASGLRRGMANKREVQFSA